jgi:hypothetical protein
MRTLLRLYPEDAAALAAANVLFQVALLVALAWILLRVFRQAGAAVRYGIWLSVLAAVLLTPFVAVTMTAAGCKTDKVPLNSTHQEIKSGMLNSDANTFAGAGVKPAITSPASLTQILEKRWPLDAIKQFCIPERRTNPLIQNLVMDAEKTWKGTLYEGDKTKFDKISWYGTVRDEKLVEYSLKVQRGNNYWLLEIGSEEALAKAPADFTPDPLLTRFVGFKGETVADVLKFYGKNFSDLKLMDEPPGKLSEVDFKYSWGGKHFRDKFYLQYDAKKLFSIERKWNMDAILSAVIVRGERKEDKTAEVDNVSKNDTAKDGNPARLKALLKEDPNLVLSKDNNGYTLLHIAVALGHKDEAELLLAMGADVNAKNNNGSTPLSIAAGAGYNDVVELLLANKADVNAKNIGGQTPLHTAAAFFHKDIAELLRQHGGHE